MDVTSGREGDRGNFAVLCPVRVVQLEGRAEGKVPICDHCGDEIEFRWVGGVVRPIHVNGGWCSGGSERDSSRARSSFDTAQSYLDPNARCPVCGALVFFYRSPHNGRVFFDDVGWPWPKHPCTDKYQGQDNQITKPNTGHYRVNLINQEGKPLDVYRAKQFTERERDLLIRLKNAVRGPPVVVLVARAAMHAKGVKIEDIKEVPTLVLSRTRGPAGETEISFLSARLQSIVVLPAAVMRTQAGSGTS